MKKKKYNKTNTTYQISKNLKISSAKWWQHLKKGIFITAGGVQSGRAIPELH